MTKDVACVNAEDFVLKAIDLLKEKKISGLPVVDKEKHVLGVFSGTDVIKLIGDLTENHPFLIPFFELLENKPQNLNKLYARAGNKKIKEIMSKPAIKIDENATLENAATLMWKKDINRLPVVDKDGILTGIITRRDLLATFKQ